MKAAVFLLYSFWIPQIVLCVRTDCRQPLRAAYVVGMSLCRLALPLYLYGCPRNLLRVAPSPGVCVGLVLFVGLQVRRQWYCGVVACGVHDHQGAVERLGPVLHGDWGPAVPSRRRFECLGAAAQAAVAGWLQAAVLLAQERWGPRCFIPKVRVGRQAHPCRSAAEAGLSGTLCLQLCLVPPAAGTRTHPAPPH